jgi:cytochrome c nitrite reductase small subunit
MTRGISRVWQRIGGSTPWALALVSGIIGGIIGFTGMALYQAKGFAYLSNDPQACSNCHVMREVNDDWNHASHKSTTVCNDCHTPHDLIGKYTAKAVNGYRHSAAFTIGGFPEPIKATWETQQTVLTNCIFCHGDIVSMISYEGSKHPTDCLRCHYRAGHGV